MRDGVNPGDLVYPQSTSIKFEFPERGPGLPACTVNWYDGVENIPNLEARFTRDGKDRPLRKPGKVLYGQDIAFQGGSHSSPLRIVPREKFIEIHETLPRFPRKNSNHYANFLLACKGEEQARSPFAVSGLLTQVFNLGVICQRLGGEIVFDARTKQITNNKAGAGVAGSGAEKGLGAVLQVTVAAAGSHSYTLPQDASATSNFCYQGGPALAWLTPGELVDAWVIGDLTLFVELQFLACAGTEVAKLDVGGHRTGV